jgi:cephalosporin hydroxylase
MPTTPTSVTRKIVRPVVGERGWALLREANRKYRRYRRRRARELNRRQKHTAMSKDLSKLATHFGTDKWGNHKYTPHYQHHLGHLRESRINLLEIGIGGYSRAGAGGASLRMWKAFFPQGQITGLDLQDKSFVNEDRIRAFQGDQTDAALLHEINTLAGPFDVIIDDGSHRSAHIIATFEILFPLLKDGGIYVVEDTQTSYWPEFGGSERRDSEATSMGLLKRLADGLNWEEFVDEGYEPSYTDQYVKGLHFYHNMVFIEKGENREGTKKTAILKKRYERSV